MKRLRQRLTPEGDFWNRVLERGGHYWPEVLEPIFVPIYALLFLLLVGRLRRAVMANYAVLFSERSWLVRFGMAWRMYTSFSFCITDAVRCRAQRAANGADPMDWEFEGIEAFEKLAEGERGGIILTAHMGNYDVAAAMYARVFKRRLNTVRAPEKDPEVQARRKAIVEAEFPESLRVHFNTSESMLGLDLTRALHAGELVAIQGDRVLMNVSEMTAPFSEGWSMRLPRGPFVLSQIAGEGKTGVEIYPLFVIRRGWRRYRIMVLPSFNCARAGAADRAAALDDAAAQWVNTLKPILRKHWHQWYVFDEVFQPVEPSS